MYPRFSRRYSGSHTRNVCQLVFTPRMSTTRIQKRRSANTAENGSAVVCFGSTGWASTRFGTVNHQSSTHPSPTSPMTRNGSCQRSLWNHQKQRKMAGGVTIAPSPVPLWKMALPRLRSLGAITWRMVRMPHGQLPASNTPSITRQANSAQ